MKEDLEIYEKEGTEIKNYFWVCDCGGRFRWVTLLFVGYNENSPHLVQCLLCKDVQEIEYWRDKSDEFVEGGWKLKASPLKD